MALTQTNRLLTLTTTLGDDTLLLNGFSGRETLSKPFEFELTLVSSSGDLELKEVLGTAMTVELVTSQPTPRYFHGYVSAFGKTGSDGGLCHYQATLSPFTVFLEQRINCRIFQDKSRQAIINAICAEYGSLAAVEFHVAKDPVMTLCVQFEESDFAFISRLAEEAGWAYVFHHTSSQHTLAFYDDTRYVPDLPGAARLEFNHVPGGRQDTIRTWSGQRQILANRVAAKTYDFKDPRNPLKAGTDSSQPAGSLPKMEAYRYDGPYTYQDLDEGERFTRLAMDALDAQAKQFEGESDVRHLQPGYSFELARHWEMDAGSQDDRTFLVLSIDHAAWNNLGTGTGGSSTSYHNGFTCIRKKIPFRPGRKTPRPCMRGLQSATVVGPSGEEIYCDAHGRIKVQFPWDREGAFNDQSSCWIRVASQWAGGRFGMVSLPRVGTEVLVDFLDGDPDLPIVVGAVYNATNMPPWELPASKTQSGIYTCSTPQGGYDNANTLRFEDKKGQEEIWLHAENTLRTEAEGSESHSVGGGRTKTVGQDETSKVQGNRTETVGGNDAVTVTGIRTEQAKEVNVTASDRITFTVGGSTITLTPSGITLQSAKIDLNP